MAITHFQEPSWKFQVVTCVSSRPAEFLSGLPQGFSLKDHAHDKAYEGMQERVNDFKLPGYRGPSPPTGDHHYEIWLYALDSRVDAGHKVR